ncbi:uncharacterized protein PAC_19143 [Phialocephala subalpina]|uniref:N-acetylgalactosaminide beta-1,3-galactosyltransferase n=1 Tax=Phialocephala subalpina TaxID=576137 RepID=A0A1L7XW30_9HELO|nr:uncharacterized protein PAC_19143 [Phialocephala subalpina]
MLSNPFSRPMRTIFLVVIFLLAGMFYYRPVHKLPHGFPHLDTETLHQYLNRSEHAQKPLVLMSKLQKQFQFSECVECVPEIQVVSSIQHHYRTETKTKTVSDITTTTTTSVVKATCDSNLDNFSAPKSSKEDATPEQLTIAKLRDQGITIIFKTGAQEVSHLAIQVGTTLRYLSPADILFFSDQQGSIGPFLINDALRNVDQKLKNDHPDFDIYRKIKEYQKTGQDIEELQEDKTKGNQRSGWKLDKYKFMHMLEEAFEMRPDAKWYVFIETDSYVFWDNLAEWLKRFDSTKPWYIGSMVELNGVKFAHGGSGYILSNAAMNKLLGPDQPQGVAAGWDARMKDTPYGDMAVGIALKEKGVQLSVAHPMMNGYKSSTFTYGPNNHWCQPVVTMHRIAPHEVSNVWRYERQRELLGMANATLFADLYSHFVEPHLVDSRDNWDNLSHGSTYSQEKADLENQQRKEVEGARKKQADEKQKKEKGDKEREDKLKKEDEKEGEEAAAAGSDARTATETKASDDEKDVQKPKPTATPRDDDGPKKKDGTAKPGKDNPKPKDDKGDDKKQDIKKSDISMEDVKNKHEDTKGETDTKKEDVKEDVKKEVVTEVETGKEDSAGKESSNEDGEERTAQKDRDESTQEKVEIRSVSTKNSNLARRGESQHVMDAQSHAHESFEKCGKLCEEMPECFQWV